MLGTTNKKELLKINKELEIKEQLLMQERDKIYNELMRKKKEHHTRKIKPKIKEIEEIQEYGLKIAKEIEDVRKELRDNKKRLYKMK